MTQSDLKPGDHHYRAFVGPSRDYDLVASMVFNLLSSLGLREHHRVLDIGCGSLRVGRLLIPYLKASHYFGFEPNEWLISEGIENELGKELIFKKKPTFLISDDPNDISTQLNFEFIFAQSIFSHTGKDLLEKWLKHCKNILSLNGVLLATFVIGDNDTEATGWVYPECVDFTEKYINELGREHSYKVEFLNWTHPRQKWVAFCNPNFNSSLFAKNGTPSWNNALKALYDIG